MRAVSPSRSTSSSSSHQFSTGYDPEAPLPVHRERLQPSSTSIDDEHRVIDRENHLSSKNATLICQSRSVKKHLSPRRCEISTQHRRRASSSRPRESSLVHKTFYNASTIKHLASPLMPMVPLTLPDAISASIFFDVGGTISFRRGAMTKTGSWTRNAYI